MYPPADKNRYGYYTVGDFKTYSKLEAIELSGKIKQPLQWRFNQPKFEQFDWTHEPPGSLEFWYKQRAQQLREQYDYIVIWYSGGADSHNVLMSFVRNNIFVDEIAQYHNLNGDKGNKNTYLNEEVFATSAPITQDLIANNPLYRHTKHRLVDLSDIQMKILKEDSNKWDYVYKVGTHPSPNALARSYLREVIPDYVSLIEQGKRVCFLFGAEKPLVQYHNADWYVAFQDMLDNAVSPRTQMLNRAWEHDELFYWSDTMPQLAAKQAHVVKRFLSGLSPELVDNVHVSSYNKLYDEYGRKKVNSWCANIDVSGIKYQLLPDGLHRLIYPDWNPMSVVANKPPSTLYTPRDTWMFNSAAPDIGQKYYHHGLLHLRQLVKKAAPEYWWEFKYDPESGMPYVGGLTACYNRYCLTPKSGIAQPTTIK
jgi:hypothetical protein